MNNETILRKAIMKAEKNGFKRFDWERVYDSVVPINNVIFSHDFAKAFWEDQDGARGYKGWELGLQQMVLEEEPLKYIEKFL